MTKRLWIFSLLLPAVLMLAGCAPETTAQSLKEYDLKGTVVSIDKPKVRITIDHEDIPGLMHAMKMEFDAPNPEMLAPFKAGDAVVGKVRHTEGKYIITELKRWE